MGETSRKDVALWPLAGKADRGVVDLDISVIIDKLAN
jgi:hypothetical protein